MLLGLDERTVGISRNQSNASNISLFLETRAAREISQNRFKKCIYESLVTT